MGCQTQHSCSAGRHRVTSADRAATRCGIYKCAVSAQASAVLMFYQVGIYTRLVGYPGEYWRGVGHGETGAESEPSITSTVNVVPVQLSFPRAATLRAFAGRLHWTTHRHEGEIQKSVF